MFGSWILSALLQAAAPALAPPLRVDDPAALFVSPLAIETLVEPRWLVHTPRPGDKLTRIAARYAVTVAQLRKWNGLDPNEDATRRRRSLRVHTVRVVPPPIRVAYVVGPGETWDDIAAKLRVRRRALQASHHRMRTPIAGALVVAWIDPIEGPAFALDAEDLVQEVALASDARSTGTPQRGRLEHGPNWSGPHKPLVRHSDGHDTHIHVRVRCGDDEPRCRSERAGE